MLVCPSGVKRSCWQLSALHVHYIAYVNSVTSVYRTLNNSEQDGGKASVLQVPHLPKPALGLQLCLATRAVGWHTQQKVQRSEKQQGQQCQLLASAVRQVVRNVG